MIGTNIVQKDFFPFLGQYDESALLEIPVHLDQTDFRPTWYHDTSHIPKESHNVYFKKKNKNGHHHHSKKKNRRGR